MWIHESFPCYSEGLFTESLFGKPAGQEYVHGQRRHIQNDRPFIGPYGVNREGSGDMYDKGANLLNMVRTIINDDAKWRDILRGLGQEFYHQTVTSEQIIGFINQQSGLNLTPVFDQYLRHTTLPVLEFRFENGKPLCRWVADVRDFTMPVRVRTRGGEYQFISPTTKFAPVTLPGLTRENLEVDTFNYYIGVLVD